MITFKEVPPSYNSEYLFLNPHLRAEADYDRIYVRGEVEIGPPRVSYYPPRNARKNTAAFIGVDLGDEGKGRFVNNWIGKMLEQPDVQMVYNIRFNGGNNSGHTLEKEGLRIAVHVVPGAILHDRAIGIIDRGVVVHPEDLQTEVLYVEDRVGDTRGRILLSEMAILATDLERAEEYLNTIKRDEAKGGTKRGISPAYANFLTRQGFHVYQILADNWRELFAKQYDIYQKMFGAFGLNLAEVIVPDFKAEKEGREPKERSVGTQAEFLDRLEEARRWLKERKMTVDTFSIYREIFPYSSIAVGFEGAQAVGLDHSLGTIPDKTASDTTAGGIKAGTAFWRAGDIENIYGVSKGPYISSVGVRVMPTQVYLPKDLDLQNPQYALTREQQWAAYVTLEANEVGTTSRRRRNMLNPDFALRGYNCRMGEILELALTHIDIAREEFPIKICTHYRDKNGNYVPYQPGLRYQENVVPQNLEVPGWDGQACRRARRLEDLPENALKFMALMQRRLGYPIVMLTNGPDEANFIDLRKR